MRSFAMPAMLRPSAGDRKPPCRANAARPLPAASPCTEMRGAGDSAAPPPPHAHRCVRWPIPDRHRRVARTPSGARADRAPARARERVGARTEDGCAHHRTAATVASRAVAALQSGGHAVSASGDDDLKPTVDPGLRFPPRPVPRSPDAIPPTFRPRRRWSAGRDRGGRRPVLIRDGSRSRGHGRLRPPSAGRRAPGSRCRSASS